MFNPLIQALLNVKSKGPQGCNESNSVLAEMERTILETGSVKLQFSAFIEKLTVSEGAIIESCVIQPDGFSVEVLAGDRNQFHESTVAGKS